MSKYIFFKNCIVYENFTEDGEKELLNKEFEKKLKKLCMNEKNWLRTNLVVQICSKAEILHTITKIGNVCSKMSPKRQQKKSVKNVQ